MQNLLKYIGKSHITNDSRIIRKGDIFVAQKGISSDGHDFIEMAIQNGAASIIHSCDLQTQHEDVEYTKLDNTNNPHIISSILKQFYKQPQHITAVTGTNGKTSICYMAAELASSIFGKSGYIGTLGFMQFENGKIYKHNHENDLTTPDIFTLYRNLDELSRHGIQHVFIEASSVGIKQERMCGLDIGISCFTNFTRDHLDYHKTLEEYFHQKSRLFSELTNKNGIAILNADDSSFAKLTEICQTSGIKFIDYGKNAQHITLLSFKSSLSGIEISTPLTTSPITSKLVGDFQVHNLLCVIAILSSLGVNIRTISKHIPSISAPCGRLQKIQNSRNLHVFVDYAHTPDALEKSITTLKNLVTENGKMFTLFGCGGNRDTGKRPIMGKIASDLSDFVFITDDNPRLENPTQIQNDIISGCTHNNFATYPDREIAIKIAISTLKPNDILLIAGKGHENYQIIGTKKTHFSDIEIATKYINC